MPTEIREKHLTTADELRALLSVANTEIEWLNQQLAHAHRQMEAIGAGGVSSKRITDDGALAALKACERAYHQAMLIGTPENCYAHDKARARFWRVFGGAHD